MPGPLYRKLRSKLWKDGVRGDLVGGVLAPPSGSPSSRLVVGISFPSSTMGWQRQKSRVFREFLSSLCTSLPRVAHPSHTGPSPGQRSTRASPGLLGALPLTTPHLSPGSWPPGGPCAEGWAVLTQQTILTAHRKLTLGGTEPAWRSPLLTQPLVLSLVAGGSHMHKFLVCGASVAVLPSGGASPLC